MVPSGGRWKPCPECGKDRVAVGERVISCFACGLRLDAVGAARRDGRTWEEAAEWATGGVSVEPAEFRPTPAVELAYPPGVLDLWSACRRVDRDRDVARWLDSRGVDVDVIARMDLARALPSRGVPEWAAGWLAGWRCVLPAWDAWGVMRTLRARWTSEGAPSFGGKTMPPKGYGLAGTALAGPVCPPLDVGDVLVVEGEPAYLHAVSRVRGVAVVGVYAGCGGRAMWSRVRGRVWVATDADAPGDDYAAKISGWCPSAVRVRPPDGMGWDDGWVNGWRPTLGGETC
jgi:hypothetical protein